MIEKYGLFDSLEGDEREYAEVDFARLARALGRDGVRGGLDALSVSAAASGLGVTVAPGLAMVQGRYYALEDDGSGAFTLSLTAANAYPRIDRIVLELDFAERRISLGVLPGAEAAEPAAPELTRDTAKYMLSLAQVYVAVGAGALAQENIADERVDEALCGLYVSSADAAMAKAVAAAEAASEAEEAAKTANTEAGKRVKTVNGASPDAAGNVNVKVGVAGAAEGDLPVFDANGDLVSSGKGLYDFTRALMTLDGTTLIITTVDKEVAAIVITKQPADVTCAANDTVVFSVEAVGDGLTYQWEASTNSGASWSNSTMASATTSELTLTAKSYHNGYMYRCLITDANGNTRRTNEVTLTVTA
ncbi:MAG: hypothetical protein IJ313_01210 [Clostridia bacterium]|nr:hypothetical protein [Clostridia bacterium]